MRGVDQCLDVGGAGGEIHRQDREQHQQRTEQRVEEELEAGINAPLAAPHADDEEHRDQAALEEDVEEEKIERRKHAHHQGFEDQERDHVFGDARFDFPARQDAERHQRTGQYDEQHGDAVDAHMIGDAVAQPGGMFDKLEGGRMSVEMRPQHQRQYEVGQGDDHRHPARRVRHCCIGTARQEDDRRAEQRQEGDEAEDVAHEEVHHGATPTIMNQVVSATTPISMAKA